MKKVILHIGPYKTGSTSIQFIANKNRELLLNEHGILYPSFHYDHGPLFRNAFKKNPENCHNNIVEKKNRKTIEKEVSQSLLHMENEIAACDCDILFISGEHISDLTKAELSNLKNYLNQFSPVIEVCYFVREPLKLILSDLQESVKTGRATLDNWSFDYILPRYYQNLKDLETVFGNSNLHIINFESAVKYGKGLVQYFFEQAFNINFNVEGEQKANDSVSDFSFKMLEKLNVLQPSVVDGQKNENRSNSLVKLLKAHKGSKINIDLPLSTDFISKLNKTLVLLEHDFNVHYEQLKTTDKLSALTEVNVDDMKSFMNELNEYFLSVEKEQNTTVNLLRDSALALENINFDLAVQLMKQAKQLRPNGPFINEKLDEYQKRVSKNA